MPEFLVEFDRPIWYQPDHPNARRETQALIANAPDVRSAEMHAIRVTRGDAQIKQTYPLDEAPEDLVRIARATFTLPLYTDPQTGLRTAIQPDAGSVFVAPEGDRAGG